MEGKPGHRFFLIAVPEAEASNVHLKALSEISRKLMHSEVREGLMNCGSFEDFLKVF